MHALLGSLMVALGGCCVAVYVLPLKYGRRWVWENQWMVGMTVKNLILPILQLKFFVPETPQLLMQAGGSAVAWSFIAGLYEGSAALLFAYSNVVLGVSMSYSVMISAQLIFATMIPLFGAHRHQVVTLSGLTCILGVLTLTGGALMAGMAGNQRDRERQRLAIGETPNAHRVRVAVIVLIAIWIDSLLLPTIFSWEWGKAVTASAEASGIPRGLSTFVILFPWYIGMFAFNVVYLAGKMIKDETIKNFWTASPGLLREYLVAVSIGLLWYLGQGILLIGGYRRLGELQVAVGSALFLGPVFVVSNLVGVLLD